jgi:hypothetical protein
VTTLVTEWSRDAPKRVGLGRIRRTTETRNVRTYEGFSDGIELVGRLVAHRGFEPLISALRGRCPRPLDECAVPFAIDEEFTTRDLRGSNYKRDRR